MSVLLVSAIVQIVCNRKVRGAILVVLVVRFHHYHVSVTRFERVPGSSPRRCSSASNPMRRDLEFQEHHRSMGGERGQARFRVVSEELLEA